MLFDNNDLAIFKDKSERTVFNEILESYYSCNYRSSIVSLYSLVIYDLFLKLNEMSDMGNKKAKTKLNELVDDINKPDKHYSDIEKNIINFFKENYSTYFSKFSSDIDYLTVLRHKCAHLFLSENELFVPSQAQTKMLIESMFNHLFKVDAPFIDDLFGIIKDEIEEYDLKYFVYWTKPREIREKLVKKYYHSMLEQSISKTINTLFKLMFISNDEEAGKHLNGMFVLLDSILWYSNSNALFNQLDFSKVENLIVTRLDLEKLSINQLHFLTSLGCDYPIVRTMYSRKEGVISFIREQLLKKPVRLISYYDYFTTEELNELFINNKIKNISDADYSGLYNLYVNNLKMDKNIFFPMIFRTIDTFNAYSKADVVTKIFMDNFENITEVCLTEVLEIYNSNPQCYRRENNDSFVEFIKDKDKIYTGIDFSKYTHICSNT